MTKTTVLFIMPRLPYPASSGRKTSLYHYCRIIHDELNCRLVVAAFLESGDRPSDKPAFIDRLEILPKPKTIEKFRNVILGSLIRKKYPLQVSLFLSKQARKNVEKLIEEEKPDVVIGDMVRSTEYIRSIHAYTIADLDDRISLRYKRQLEVDIEGINPYGAFLITVPKPLRSLMLLKPVKTSVVKNEIFLLNKYEIDVGRECSATVFVAKKEAEDFNKELKENKAVAVPIGVDTDYFSYRECGNNDENYIGFLGALNVAHNENAVRHFILNILPDVIEKVPDAKFMVVGGGASDDLLKLASDHVIFTGGVDDVREHLEKCKVFACPMTFGSGIKTKNLEAMAMGLPVVTTTIGAENIGAINDVDWIETNDDTEMAMAIIKLLKTDIKRKQLSLNGSSFALKNWSWGNATEQLKKLIERD